MEAYSCITDEASKDASQRDPLLKPLQARMNSFTADGGYGVYRAVLNDSPKAFINASRGIIARAS